MSSTNKTANYDLSQFVGTDIPNPLTDYNGDMEKIDTAMHNIAEAGTTVGADVEALKGRVTTAESDIDALEAQNGTDVLQTVAQTLSGAVNELKGKDDALDGRLDTVEASLLSKAENSDVLALGNRVAGVEGDVTALEGVVGDANSGLVKEVADVDAKSDANASEIASVKAGGDIIFIAASYGITPSANDNCIVHLRNILANQYDNIYDASEGGAGFVNGRYLALLQSLEETVINHSNVKEIVIIGQGNDSNNSSTDIVNAMINFRTYANAQYPNAKIMVAPVSTRTNPTDANAVRTVFDIMTYSITNTRIGVYNSIFHVLAYFYNEIGSDGVHPTNVGASSLARAIANAIMGGDFNPTTESIYDTPTVVNPSINLSTHFDNLYIGNGVATIWVGCNFSLNANTNISNLWGQGLELFDCNPEFKGHINQWEKEFDGVMYDITSDKLIPIAMSQRYNDVDNYYYWELNSRTGLMYTLEANHIYSFRVTKTIPFATI